IRNAKASLNVRNMKINLKVEQTERTPSAFVNRRKVSFDSGKLFIPYSQGKELTIDLYTNY
ncbi:MAG: hypothetical protein ACPL1K_07535, partial [Candidatus Kryptoniota bacterium]